MGCRKLKIQDYFRWSDSHLACANRLVKTKLPEITCYDTGDGIGSASRPETTTVYLKNGWVSSVTDANGNTSSTLYDDAGRKTKVTNAAGNVIDYTYDKAGNILTQIVRNADFSGDQTTAYAYDKRNLLLTETLMPGTALERTTAYTYDNLGNKASRTFPDSASTVYSYDALNRLILESYTGATGENRSYTYNLNGAVITAIDSSGKTIYTYDALGRITSEEKKDLSDASLSVVSNIYDKAGNRTLVSYPEGKVLTFTYDKRNLLSTVTDGTDVTSYSYDANGNRTGLSLPNGVVTNTTFDAANRVTQLANLAPDTSVIYTTDYRMDKVGNRLKITETRPAGTRNLIYTYDNVYRLLTESDDISGTAVVTSYTFDAAGNRLSKSDGTTTVTYTVDQLNRVISATKGTEVTNYTYDLNGNRLTKNDGTVTHTYSYSRENQLVDVSDGSNSIFSAVYDYRTRRMSKVENSATTHYVYDGGVNVQELDSARSLTKQLVRGTGMGGGIGSVLYNEDASASNREFFCYTAIGSVVAMTDSTGAVTSTTSYEAFGKEVASTGSTTEDRKFCTKERDASIGLDNFGFRYYDADLGRFITRDPSGYPDGPNNYLYCHNNPINFIDPLGLQAEEDAADRTLKDRDIKQRLTKIGSINREERRAQNSLMNKTLRKLKGLKDQTKIDEIKEAYGKESATITKIHDALRSEHEEFINERFQEYRQLQLADSGINFVEHGLINIGAFGLKNIYEGTGGESIYGEKLSTEERVYKQLSGYSELALWTLPAGSGIGQGIQRVSQQGLKQSMVNAGRFFYDPRNFSTISRQYWGSQGGAGGRSLHHWLFGQANSKVPLGLRNAGFNQLNMPGMRGIFHAKLGANQWMGFAQNWGGGSAFAAKATEQTIRVAIPASAVGAGCGGYKLGEQIQKQREKGENFQKQREQ